MLKSKSQKLIFPLFAVLGLAYFTSVSHWEINFLLKNYLALIPLQILGLIYVFIYWKNICHSE
jgi:hypothetical protein